MKCPLLFVVAFLILGCARQSSKVSMSLASADSMVEDYPDSSLRILEGIDTVAISNDGDRALYILLLNQSQYKLYKPTPQDHLLTFCVDYYLSKGDEFNLCRAYYYRGMTLYERGLYEKALASLKDGERIARTIESNIYKSKYYESLFLLNLQSRNFRYALKYGHLFLDVSKTVCNYDDIARGYMHIAEVYDKLKKQDSATLYMNYAYTLVDSVSMQYKAEILANMGVIYRKEKRYEEAKKYLKASLKIKELDNAQKVLADIYYEEGREDKAIAIWKKLLLKNVNTGMRMSILNEMANHYKRYKRFDTASIYLDGIKQISDSVYTQTPNVELSNIQSEYDKAAVTEENGRNKIVLRVMLVIFVLGVCMVLLIKKELKDNMQRQVLKDNEAEKAFARVKELEEQNKKNEKISRDLKLEKSKIETDYAETLSKGRESYEYLLKNKRLSLEDKAGKYLVLYYKFICPEINSEWDKTYEHLTHGQYLYLVLCDMNFSKEEIMDVLGIGYGALRSIKSRLKSKERSDGC